MAARIFGAVLVKQIGIVRQEVMLQSWRNTRPPIARLHVKVFDKDADLDKQREQNRHNLNAEHDFDGEFKKESNLWTSNKNILPTKKLEHVNAIKNGKERTAMAVSDDDPDTFGSTVIKEQEFDDDDDDDNQASTRRTKKLRNIEYARLIKDHLKANQLKAAIDVLEKKILKEDGAKPDNYIYNLLISGCAKAGYTKKAFSLFTKMRQRGLTVKGGVYTSLFNACSNAPTAAEGLERAQRLREIMLEKAYEPNEKNYNAMIKAYGRCGDVKIAYLLADEMMERKLPLNTDTFNFLLQACASDKEFGFRHCLLTWHKMLKSNLRPDYYTFNLVLRCTRDCGFGNLPTMNQLLQQILRERSDMQISIDSNSNQIQLETKTHINPSATLPDSAPTATSHAEVANVSDISTLQVINDATKLEIPNLLAPRPHLGSMVSLAEVKQAHERFLLLGGLNGFLELMKHYAITPNIQTFTTLLEVIPPTNAAEKQVLTFIRKIGLKADIDFFNILIKKRSMRFDYDGAKEVLSMIRTAGLKPDIVTYGVLALSCKTVNEARELLLQMHQYDIRMNIQILGAMLRQGCAHKSFNYIIDIMQISLDENIKPNDIFLRHLHNFHTQCARALDSRHPSTKSSGYKKDHAKFCDKYRLYQQEHGIADLKIDDAIKKIKVHPYAQYKEETIEGIEPMKNVNLARKQKLRKYIKKIKIDSLRNDDVTHDDGGGDIKAQPKFNPNKHTKQLN